MECNSCVLEADASERNALESIRSPDGCKQLIAFEANFVCIQGHQSGRNRKPYCSWRCITQSSRQSQLVLPLLQQPIDKLYCMPRDCRVNGAVHLNPQSF